MKPQPYNAVLVVGKFASGKTMFCQYLDAFLTRDGIAHEHLSDRLAFEQAVLQDTKNAEWVEGVGYVGKSSILVEDGEPGKRNFAQRMARYLIKLMSP